MMLLPAFAAYVAVSPPVLRLLILCHWYIFFIYILRALFFMLMLCHVAACYMLFRDASHACLR